MNVACYYRSALLDDAGKQRQEVRNWCAAQGYTIISEYSDGGHSGRLSGERPAFGQMVEAAQSAPLPFDAIVVHSLSRLTRDAGELMQLEKLLKQKGVEVVSVTQQPKVGVIDELVRRYAEIRYTGREEK